MASGSDAGSEPEVPVAGRYEIGDIYTDGEFDAVYLDLDLDLAEVTVDLTG